MVMGWVVFSGSLPSLGTRRCALSVGIRSRIARLAGLCGGSCAPNAVPSLRVSRATPPHPSRSSAWFKAAQCAALELRDEEFAKNFHVAFKRGTLKVGFKQKLVAHTRGALKAAFKQKLVARVTRVAHVPRRRKIQVRSPAPCWLQSTLQVAEHSK